MYINHRIKMNEITGFEITQERIDVIKKVALEDFGLQI